MRICSLPLALVIGWCVSWQLWAAPYPFADDFEAGIGNWVTNGTWGLTTAAAVSPSHAVADSPSAFYNNSRDTALTLASSLNLAGATRPALSFQHRYALEADWDFVRVELSTNGGASWLAAPLASYTGNQSAWTREQLDLGSCIGRTDVRIRFRLVTDDSVVMDGWYLDNIRLGETPAPVTTLSAVTVTPTTVSLQWTPSDASDFATYRLYRSLTANVAWQTATCVATLTDRNASNYTDIAVSPKTAYFYRLMVMSTNNLHALGNEVSTNTPAGMSFPFFDNGESGPATWIAEAPWALSEELALSPTHAWSDSPGANYGNGIGSQSLTLSGALDLRGKSSPVLSYRHQCQFLSGDYGLAEVSADNGSTWTTLATYTAGTPTNIWLNGRHSLASYTNFSQVLVRFRLTTDASGNADGWHVDDIAVCESPSTVDQPGLTEIASHSIRLIWTANTDTTFSHYAIFRSTTPGVGINATLVTNLYSQSATTFTDDSLTLDTLYYYRVYAVNPYGAFSADSALEASARTLNNPVPFADDFDGSLTGWKFTGTWNVTTGRPHGGTYCLTDSPDTLYANNTDATAMTAVNLVGTTWPVLKFWDRCRMVTPDLAAVEVSPDGSTWYRLYEATGIQTNWTERCLDLSPWKNQSNLRIRFHLVSNESNTEDGWFVDDISVVEHTPATSVVFPFYEGFENGLSNWIASTWVMETNNPYGGAGIAHDTPGGQRYHGAWTYYNLTLGNSLVTTGAINPQLTFWIRSALSYASYFWVQTSTDGGLTWSTVLDIPVCVGWTRQQISLPKSDNLRLRFQTASHPSYWGDTDVYLDNIGIGDAEPSAPTLFRPLDRELVPEKRPTLSVNNAVDYQGNPLTYRFEVYFDGALSMLAAQVPSVAAGAGVTSWIVDSDLANNGQYWWRCRVANAVTNGPWMPTATFYVSQTNSPPNPVVLAGPSSAAIMPNLNSQISWYAATDPDIADAVIAYHLQIDTSYLFTNPVISDAAIAVSGISPGSNWVISVPLGDFLGTGVLSTNTSYFWRICAEDSWHAHSTWSTDLRWFVYGVLPAKINGFRPNNGCLELEWERSILGIYVDFSPSIVSPVWQPIAGPIFGTRYTVTPDGIHSQGFYRVRTE